MKNQNYRTDIDVLRAFAVLIVILFHCDISWFKGGFIGVDIFFVISGYVMFQSFPPQRKLSLSDFAIFYKKRLFRIYPALLLTLFLTTVFTILWFSTGRLDSFGKHLFFSSFSASNILFADGHNYFNPKTPILLHTWSLGVEMQFYMLFPFLMLLHNNIKAYKKYAGVTFLLLATAMAFFYAHSTTDSKGAFFLLQNRAFEFLIGMCIATFVPIKRETKNNAAQYTSPLIILGLAIITIMFEPNIQHPGLYTLAPIMLSAAFITLHARYPLPKSRGIDHLTYFGRISYGLYLFHFPVTIFAKDIFHLDTFGLLLANIMITIPLAHLSYQYFETPIRRGGYNIAIPYKSATLILLLTVSLAGFGYLSAKKEGWPERLQYFNPYAHQITKIHTQSKTMFKRGYDIQKNTDAKVLFIGDSLLQQYIDPIAKNLNLSKDDIDSVTRGGCLLLHGVEFQDQFADISCNDLRNKLYHNVKTYDLIIISQDWAGYRKTLLNANKTEDKESYDYIIPFIQRTIQELGSKADNIVILGEHPRIKYSNKLEIGPFFKKQDYKAFKNSLTVRNNDTKRTKHLFSDLSLPLGTNIIHPVQLLCPSEQECVPSDKDWAYFYDSQHLTSIGQDIVQKRLSPALKGALTNMR
ncbi:MAG: acyltransferase family protein [Alphaproteobacteria bacterium]